MDADRRSGAPKESEMHITPDMGMATDIMHAFRGKRFERSCQWLFGRFAICREELDA